MTDGDTRQALDRIDRALARIEAATRAAPAASETSSALALRHERLRARVRETLEWLDALIADGAG